MVHVKYLASNQALDIEVSDDGTVGELRLQCQMEFNLHEHPIEQLHLICSGKYLQDNQPLSSIGNLDSTHIFLVVKGAAGTGTEAHSAHGDVPRSAVVPVGDSESGQPAAYGSGQPVYEQPVYGQPVYGQPAYGAPVNLQPMNSPPPNFDESQSLQAASQQQQQQQQHPPPGGFSLASMRTGLGRSVRSIKKDNFAVPGCGDSEGGKNFGIVLALVLAYLVILGYLVAVSYSTKSVYTDLSSGGAGPVVGVCFAFLILACCLMGAVVMASKQEGLPVIATLLCGVLIICVFVLGFGAGIPYYEKAWVEGGTEAKNVNASEPAIMTSRAFDFIPGTRVDYARGAWATIRGGKSSTTYCVAPIVSMAGQEVVSYWAFETTCCRGGTWSSCDGWAEPDWHAGIVDARNEDDREINSNFVTVRNTAINSYRLMLSSQYRWVVWAKTVPDALAGLKSKGDLITAFFTYGWPLLLCPLACVCGCALFTKS